jgi:hypothetical protein
MPRCRHEVCRITPSAGNCPFDKGASPMEWVLAVVAIVMVFALIKVRRQRKSKNLSGR